MSTSDKKIYIESDVGGVVAVKGSPFTRTDPATGEGIYQGVRESSLEEIESEIRRESERRRKRKEEHFKECETCKDHGWFVSQKSADEWLKNHHHSGNYQSVK